MRLALGVDVLESVLAVASPVLWTALEAAPEGVPDVELDADPGVESEGVLAVASEAHSGLAIEVAIKRTEQGDRRIRR